MLNVKEIKSNVFELTLEGVIEKSDIETMERDLTPALKGEGPLGLVVRAENLQDFTADAIAEDMKYEFGMLTQWSKIAKMAVVTDLQALSALMKWIDPILPMIDMKSFSSSDVSAAEAFASDLSERQAGSGLTLLADGSEGLIAFEIDGMITQDGIEKVMKPLKPVLESDKKINLLARFKNYGGFDLGLLRDGSFLGMKASAIGHVERYAIVGAPSWMNGVVSNVSALIPIEMRPFATEDEDAAWDWAKEA